MVYIPWTDVEERILKRCSQKGLTAREIGKIIKSRSYDSILSRAKRMGLPLGQKTPEIDFDMLEKLIGPAEEI